MAAVASCIAGQDPGVVPDLQRAPQGQQCPGHGHGARAAAAGLFMGFSWALALLPPAQQMCGTEAFLQLFLGPRCEGQSLEWVWIHCRQELPLGAVTGWLTSVKNKGEGCTQTQTKRLVWTLDLSKIIP